MSSDLERMRELNGILSKASKAYYMQDTEIMSISNIFEPAFLYENEIVDLFGVKINLISIDYQGQLYRIEKQTPFK